MEDQAKPEKALPFARVAAVYFGTLLFFALLGLMASGWPGFVDVLIHAPLQNGGAMALPFIALGLVFRRWYVTLPGYVGVIWWCATGTVGV